MALIEKAIKQAGKLTFANMKARYRKTYAGFFLVILSPLITFAIQTSLFQKIFEAKVSNYHVFLLGGLLPWMFLTQSMDISSSCFQNSASLLKSFRIHPLVVLSAPILENAFNFIIAFSIVLIGLSWNKTTSIYLPIRLIAPLIFLIWGAFSLAWILATLNVFYQDTRFLNSLLINAAFFITPIFYPESLIPEGFRWLIQINLLYKLILPIREALYQFDLSRYLRGCTQAFFIALLVHILATLLWTTRKNELYFKL